MQPFMEWLFTHNNWMPGLIVFLVLALWGVIAVRGADSWKYKVSLPTGLFVIWAWYFYLGVYMDGYGSYKMHWNTCAKPEAVASFYVFDSERERCLKPVVGLVPYDDTTNKTLTPKQMETGEWL